MTALEHFVMKVRYPRAKTFQMWKNFISMFHLKGPGLVQTTNDRHAHTVGMHILCLLHSFQKKALHKLRIELGPAMNNALKTRSQVYYIHAHSSQINMSSISQPILSNVSL